MASTDTLRASRTNTRWLLIFGAMAGLIFTIAWFFEGLACVKYEWMQHAISTLSLCEFGWTQDANFMVTGLLTLALTFGVRNTLRPRGGSIWGPILFGIVAIGFIGDGFFVTDPLNSHPAGTPPLPLPPTLHGRLHLLFAAFVFCLPAACFVLARLFEDQNEHSWSIYSKVTGISFIIVYSLVIAGFFQVEGLVNYSGLFQRIALTIGLTWMTFLAMYFLRFTSEIQATGKI
jgi:hypothetical protein